MKIDENYIYSKKEEQKAKGQFEIEKYLDSFD